MNIRFPEAIDWLRPPGRHYSPGTDCLSHALLRGSPAVVRDVVGHEVDQIINEVME